MDKFKVVAMGFRWETCSFSDYDKARRFAEASVRLAQRDGGEQVANIYEDGKFVCNVGGLEDSQCRHCGCKVAHGDRICNDCNERRYGTHRFGGEVPAGVDW